MPVEPISTFAVFITGFQLNMAGKLARRGSNVRVRHIAEVLAGAADGPAIGEGE